MDAIAEVSGTTLPLEPFIVATTRANEWRGRCIDVFSRTEAAVAKTLAAMSHCPHRGGQVALPHLVGQRFEALASAIASSGPFHREGACAAEALERFREHDRLRPALCHGVGHITLDGRGRWTLVLRFAAFRGGKLADELVVVTQAEADDVLDDLTRTSQVLSSRLGNLRGALSAKQD
ncbi:hypothetical protein [Antarcticirhabdus aurantiaca]|uniref:Uncharacterized protein n=1 Tax=Antarcticirhabdus aurantiaca TaxID=2606717 RepID=A0ACD4NQE4_9HYPH|nr:hypothetical protein [Antarcticirhabdus aurantiaca]WAJ29069.1 hypothetical protein OXU80_02135 [Jeongeuplla avenae]